MIKIQKKGIDGKIYDFWQYTKEEISKMKKDFEKYIAEIEKTKSEQ